MSVFILSLILSDTRYLKNHTRKLSFYSKRKIFENVIFYGCISPTTDFFPHTQRRWEFIKEGFKRKSKKTRFRRSKKVRFKKKRKGNTFSTKNGKIQEKRKKTRFRPRIVRFKKKGKKTRFRPRKKSKIQVKKKRKHAFDQKWEDSRIKKENTL